MPQRDTRALVLHNTTPCLRQRVGYQLPIACSMPTPDVKAVPQSCSVQSGPVSQIQNTATHLSGRRAGASGNPRTRRANQPESRYSVLHHCFQLLMLFILSFVHFKLASLHTCQGAGKAAAAALADVATVQLSIRGQPCRQTLLPAGGVHKVHIDALPLVAVQVLHVSVVPVGSASRRYRNQAQYIGHCHAAPLRCHAQSPQHCCPQRSLPWGTSRSVSIAGNGFAILK